MSLVDAVAAAMFLAVVLYAVFAGADFGSGVWDLGAGDAKKGGRLRRVIDHALGPVWEANHVWLIFVLVFMWTGFPDAFAQLMRTLAIPFWLAGLGIVLRGAGFAFRKFSPSLRWARVAGVMFAASSLMTPFFLGTIAGGVASGRVPAEGTGDLWSSWINPTSLVGGVLAVLTCTFLAGVFLAADAAGLDAPRLADSLRRRSLVVGAVTGVAALAGIVPLTADAETLSDGLVGRGAPAVVVSALAGLVTLVLLWRNRLRQARASAAVAVAAIVIGWGVAQYPWILVDEMHLDDHAAEPATLWGLIVASAAAGVLVVPPLVYLLVLADRNRVGVE
ncbi:MAG: cytochrome d ubiquinol oxidase subunit II [Acidimicrobiales bacterium]